LNGALLGLIVAFIDGLFPLSAMALGFSSSGKGRGCEVMEEYASGFAEYLSGLFY
jgi:hypothetical protein